MPKQIIIAEKNHIAAVFAEEQIQELVVATGNQQVGDIYLGTVENVISGIDAAFVNIGDAEKNGFIHVTDLGPLRKRKSAGAITELLSPQQPVLVQVMKEPTGSKGPRLTGNISLPGRYLVLMPYGKGVSLSRRIKNDNERNRLRALAILLKPPGMGLLVRTEADGKAEEAIIEDLEFLHRQWEKIQQEANSLKPPSLLNRDDDFIQRVLRDMFTDEVNRIVVDSGEGVKRIKKHLSNWGGGRQPNGVIIDKHQEPQHILDYFRVSNAIKNALQPRVDLPSGGYIIIEPTEALTVIDVNSGSFTHSATSRETVLWTNYEAAVEIARQLRLRNIGGVIVVDFIDMDSRRDKIKLLEQFNRVLQGDKARPQIAQLSELGLVELTRKRQGKNIYELFGQPCPHCGGLGLVAHLPGHHDLESISSSFSPLSLVTKTVDKINLDEKFASDYTKTDTGESLSTESYSEPSKNRRRRDSSLKEEPILLTANGSSSETEVKPERKERSLLSRSLRRDESKWEKVVVEMTPSEQDVYAFMGVSPLLHLEREFKDPKSVLVYVQLPEEGKSEINQLEETEDTEAIIEVNPEDDINDNNFGDDRQEYLELDNNETNNNSDDIDIDTSTISDAEKESSEQAIVASISFPEEETITETAIKEALESDRPIVRTRRRRTSSS
jgi:ribonuclease E